MPDLSVGGLAPLTSVDFPGRLAAVVFVQGCPWGCRYCHNPHLREARGAPADGWAKALERLSRRRGLLDGVVFSGGEPTRDPALPEALAQVRALGFETALHSAGAFPERLRTALPRLDWVGLDVKAPFDGYAAVTGVPGSGARARDSLLAVLESGVDHEVRTTVHPRLHSAEALLRMADELRSLGARHWRLQEFRAVGCADESLAAASSRALLDPALEERLRALFETFEVRRSP